MIPAPFPAHTVTANDSLKQRAEAWLPRSITVAVLIHAAVFTLSPDMTTAGEAAPADDLTIIVPAEVDLPEPPAPIESPAEPILGSVELDTDITIMSTADAWTADRLPPPAATTGSERTDFERWVPSMVAPRVLNEREVESALRRAYPSILRESGIGGDVDVNLWLDETGTIVRAEVARGSGYELLDEAALKVVDAMRLSPAQNRGAPVRVIVTLPVRFRVR